MARASWIGRALGMWILLALALPGPALAASRWVDVYVALADNQHQNIVPVPAALGKGDHPTGNLYWGARYGIKTFFKRSSDWSLIACVKPTAGPVLEACLFKHRRQGVYLLARAYQGRQIRQAVGDFLAVAAGGDAASVKPGKGWPRAPAIDWGKPSLVVYIGHNGLMDFAAPARPTRPRPNPRPVIILACAAKGYFAGWLRAAGAYPLLWTTGLMAPEAYTLHAALQGWLGKQGDQAVRSRAAAAYNKYQHCGLGAARRLLVTGW